MGVIHHQRLSANSIQRLETDWKWH